MLHFCVGYFSVTVVKCFDQKQFMEGFTLAYDSRGITVDHGRKDNR